MERPCFDAWFLGNVDETAIARLPDGRLVMVCRRDGGRFYSADQGRTWKYAGRLVTSGKLKAPRLFVLEDGTVVCVCTYRGLTVFLGRDKGKTWSGPRPLDSSCYGYPGAVVLDDESIGGEMEIAVLVDIVGGSAGANPYAGGSPRQ